MEWLNPSRETKFSGTNRECKIFIFPVQLTTSRIGNLTRLIHKLLLVPSPSETWFRGMSVGGSFRRV